jgi:hypothetical protein
VSPRAPRDAFRLKEIIMRTFLLLAVTAGLSVSSAVAIAQPVAPVAPRVGMGPIDPASVPANCAAVAAVPADAIIPAPAIEARIAVASCGASARFNALTLTASDDSIAALTAAAKPSIDLLDAAIAAGDPVWTPVAQKARGDIFLSMAIRMRNSIPAITMQTVGPDLAAHDQAHAALEPKIKPWLDQAH